MNEIETGTVVEIHSLTSRSGMQLNGSRAIVIRRVEDDRFEVRVECEPKMNGTKALKWEKLRRLPRKDLPVGNFRGQANVSDMVNFAPKICELLVHSTCGYAPSQIVFQGYPAMIFARMGHQNFEYFTCEQMEQIGGVLSLAAITKEAQEPGSEGVLFALLEGDPMYLDVLAQTLYRTGLIDVESDDNEERSMEFDVPPEQLTPDQDSNAYIRTMAEGPLLVLNNIGKYVFAPALWAALQRSIVYHLLVQRLLRLIAREALGNQDGKKLGATARSIVSKLCDVPNLDRPISVDAANNILDRCGEVLTVPEAPTTGVVATLLRPQ